MASDLSSSPDWLSCSPTSPYIPVGSPNTLNTPQIVREGFVVPSPRNDIQRSNFSRTFFQPLLVGDEEERHNALIKITELLEAACDEKTQANLELLNSHLPTIVRLSTECPFPEIRKAFQEFLERIQETETEICVPSPQPFSSFFDASESALPYLLESGEFDQEFVARLCQFTFLHKGGVSHFVQLLAWHPSYLYKFFQTYDHLMYDNGVLCNDYCAYISILAASSHSCRYFIETQEQEFLDIDGDESWLEGIHAAPPKIQGLNKLNAILAHQPWRLKSSHIAELVGSGEDNWSLNELVHAILVMTTFHSISGVVLGCGILPEVRGKNFEMKWNDFSGSSSEEEEYSTPTLRLLRALSSCDDEESCQSANQPQSNVFETVDTERKRRSPLRRRKTAKNLVSKYRGDFVMSHEDFLINSPQYAVFHISDFSWKDQGYATVNEYFPSITPLLDAEFRKIYTLTYNTFSNNTDVDTSRFRMAVWHYVHRVQGLFHDDYSYDKVNFWLNIRLKNYIKTLVCYPQSMKKSDFQNMGITLTPQEKVHLTLLACEARKQAALLYGLRAIMTYQMEASRSNKN